jgi:hypothetical protein
MKTWVIACLLLTAAFSVHAETRVALVIGNGAYAHAPHLANPVHDATDVSAALGKLGYSVQLLTDVKKSAMEVALKQFGRAATGADQALIYYSGHGIEVGGVNYLLPVEASLESETDVPLEAVSLSDVMGVASRARRLALVVLDACRNNPLAISMQRVNGTRGTDKGLAVPNPTGNELVAYATRDGHTAADGAGRNSPYATAILETLQEPGLEVRLFWGRVHDRVMAATGRAQEPFIYGALGGEQLYLNPPAASPPLPSAYDPRAVEFSVWQSALKLGTLEAYRDYLTQYPAGQFSAQAKLQIAALRSRPASGAVAPATPAPKPQEPSSGASTAALTNWNAGWFMQFEEKSKAQACQRASEPDLKGSTVLQCSSFFGDDRPAFLVRLGPSKDRAAFEMTRKRYLSRGVFSVLLHNEDCSLLSLHPVECASPSP